jgi:hypothetical protein
MPLRFDRKPTGDQKGASRMGISAFGRRRWIFAAVSCLGAACLAAPLLAERRLQAQAGGDAGEESRIRQAFAITPLPINLAGKNPALVGLGNY